jgi:hypothetical protein
MIQGAVINKLRKDVCDRALFVTVHVGLCRSHPVFDFMVGDKLQGYLFSKPVPGDEAIRILHENHQY